MPEGDEADGSKKPDQKVSEEEKRTSTGHVFGQGTHPNSNTSSNQKVVDPKESIAPAVIDQQPPEGDGAMAANQTAEENSGATTKQEAAGQQQLAPNQGQPTLDLVTAPLSQKKEPQSTKLPQQEEHRNDEPSGKVQQALPKLAASPGKFHVDNSHMPPPSGEPPTSAVFSKVIMGFTVIFLIMVLVRLIQIRMKQGSSVSKVMKSTSSGASCCYGAIAISILMTGCLMVYIMHSARMAKERQHKDQMAWNYITSILLVLGVLGLMKYNQMIHQQHMSRKNPPIASQLWIYLVIAAAALAAAKISNRLLQLKHVQQNQLRP